MRFLEDVFDMEFQSSCDWLPANQFLFQLANIFLVLTYFAKPNSMFGLLQLRFALMMSGICFGIWGGFIICALDCMVWNLAFALGNGAHLVYLIVKMRPLKFDSEHECLYNEVFKPMGVKKYQYKQLMDCSKRKTFKEGGYYAKSGFMAANHIGILLHGKFEVHLGEMVISHIDPLEFLDSPEWIGDHNTPTSFYQVSVVALESSVVYIWHRSDLDNVFKRDFVIKNVFDSLIGKDICKKLFAVHKRLLIDDDTTAAPNLLHQAPLLTYSAVNLFDMHNPERKLSADFSQQNRAFLSPYSLTPICGGTPSNKNLDYKPPLPPLSVPMISVNDCDINSDENAGEISFKIPELQWGELTSSSSETASDNERKSLLSKETKL